ncbi:hypothetical protein PBV87_11645 [Niameybacter massiliensis]|uniref:Uncharacterized protein n=1 Tax=Holtiella tumoricola TaxID=3018743 RepID=A0AA42J144_9FIRM|nr:MULTISPECIES: hypothetical protein [Lachnospirales]MDA3732137.1 hypothetical protein [Holtiella tumoricola]
MAGCNVLVYGSGNCEIAALIEEEIELLGKVDHPEIKIFARGYILENSCLAMYKRFSSLKDEIGQVKRGGLYEYFYDGEEKIERHEMVLAKSSEKETFEECLQMGIKRLNADEIFLVLIGQSNATGLFWDFVAERPSKLRYEDLSQVLYRLGKRNRVKFHIIMDIPTWHGVEFPYMLVRHPYIETLFIYERRKPFHLLPIAKWLTRAQTEEMNYLEALYKYYPGYKINMDHVIWRKCKECWKNYWQYSSHESWKAFYDAYKEAVIYSATRQLEHKMKINFKTEIIPKQSREITIRELQEYLVEMYHTTFDDKNIQLWLTDLKTCTDYYKL